MSTITLTDAKMSKSEMMKEKMKKGKGADKSAMDKKMKMGKGKK